MTRWLVTGGAGFIGSHLVDLILAERPEVEVANCDALTYAGRRENNAAHVGDPRYRFVQADIADAPAVERLFAEFRPDAVLHLAAESHVDRSIVSADAFLRTNVLGTQVLLDAARRHGAARFLHVSTDEVYGSLGFDAPAFTEASPLAPNSPYAASKAASDLLARAAHHTHGLPVVITRASNNYGPRQFPEKLIPVAVTRALAGQPVPMYARGQNVRNWIHVRDHCRGLVAALERGRAGEVYNLGGADELDNRALLERLLELAGRPASLIQSVADRPGHDLRYALDSSKAWSELGWRPGIPFGDGLAETVEWYRVHHGDRAPSSASARRP